jgi:acetate---CoA ligase (ADP-forming)
MVETEATRVQESIVRLLRPASVVIVGASDKSGSLGASVLGNLISSRYDGAIHLVNPKRTEIDGRRCVASVKDLPEGIDCAVLAIPKAGVLEALRVCAERGVGAAIVFAGGFAESGEAGRAEQAEVARIARESGMTIEGPNCLGMVNAIDDIALTFVSTPRSSFPGGRGVAIVSQSGAMAAVLGVTFRAHALDLTYSISTGNEAASGVEDFVEYLLGDQHTAVIALLVEQFRKPRRFLELARRARESGKHIVLLHPGSSGAARASAATHTGAIAGDYDVMRTKVADAGVIVVETLEELVDVSHLLLRCPALPSGGTAVLTESGAFKALTLDLCERLGLAVPPLSDQTVTALRAVLPEFIPPSNPLDVTAQGLVDPDLYRRTLPPLLADDSFGSVVLTIILTDESTGALKLPPILDAISTFNLKKPIIFAGLDEGAWINPEYVARLHGLHVPFFPTAERAFRALARLNAVRSEPSITTEARAVPILRLPNGVLTEYESKKIFRAADFPVPTGELARSLDEAIAIAEQIGFPVALKAQSVELLHKTDAGGLVLNLRDRDELATGWERLRKNLSQSRPNLLLDGVLVERMGEKGVEFIVGARNDPEWGATVVVGLGGIFAEALHDVRLLVPGLTVEQIVAELHRLKGAALLGSFRGAPAPDVRAIAEVGRRLGDFMLAHREVAEVDLNPVVAHTKGATVLDALIVVSEDPGSGDGR